MKDYSTLLICALIGMLLAACSQEQNAPIVPSPSPGGIVSTGPLPDGVYKAAISAINQPQPLRAGEQTSLHVKVKNIGGGTWPAQGQGPKYKVDLGNHWLDTKGTEIVTDDGRAGLPHDLKPGEEAELLLTVKAPKNPGDYILELDMVHEDITWFKRHGSQTLKTNIKVQ